MEENEQNKILFKNLKKGYKLNSSSFTSGVMAFSTDIIEENTFLQLSDLVQRYGMIFKSYEQAPLNLFFDKWQRLPIIYNLHDYAIPKRFKQRIEAIALHVTTWKYHSISQNLDAVIYNEWTKNLEMSELINLNEVIPSKKNWTEKEINKLDRKYKIWYKYWETIFKIRTFSRI